MFSQTEEEDQVIVDYESLFDIRKVLGVIPKKR